MSALFEIRVPPEELILRGTLTYWFLFFLFRFFLRRDAGSIGLADVLLIVVIADAAQNGMAGEYKSLSEGALLVGTIAAWNFLIDFFSYRFPGFARLAEPPAVALINHGRLLTANLRKEMITREELMSQLRRSGVESVQDVKKAQLEPDGNVSVIAYSREERAHRGKTARSGLG